MINLNELIFLKLIFQLYHCCRRSVRVLSIRFSILLKGWTFREAIASAVKRGHGVTGVIAISHVVLEDRKKLKLVIVETN